MCVCESGYWQDDAIPDTEYTKCSLCNPLCDVCEDNTNKCTKCTDGMFRYLDTYCESFCPEPYEENTALWVCDYKSEDPPYNLGCG